MPPIERSAPASLPCPSAPPGALRVGFRIDAYGVPAWAGKMLETVAQSRHSTIALLVVGAEAKGSCRQEGAARRGAPQPEGGLLYRAYRALDERMHTVKADARALVDVRAFLGHVPTIETAVAGAKGGSAAGRFSGGNVAGGNVAGRVASSDLDVLVDLGGAARALRDPLLGAARHGVWVHHFGHARRRSALAGFPEVFRNEPVTRAALYRYTTDVASARPLLLQESYSPADALSVKRNRNALLWKCASLVPRALASLHQAGPPGPHASGTPTAPVRERAVEAKPGAGAEPPSSPAFLPLLLSYSARYAREKLSGQWCHQSWQLLYAFQDALPPAALRRFRRVVPPAGSEGWADPFVWRHGGTHYVFVEEITTPPRKGHISVFSLDEQSGPTPPRKIIEEPHHLSYPFLFEWQGTLYMTLESMQNGAISVYECTRFPHEWVFRKNIMEDVLAVDPTLLYHEGRWWLFAGMKAHEHASARDELYLFHAQSPLSAAWQPHPQNPVVSDARRARPAGRIFEKGGALYRPSQDCSTRYGYGLRLNRITALTPATYAEEEAAFVAPARGHRRVRGTHTLNHGAGLTVADVKVREPRWRAILGR